MGKELNQYVETLYRDCRLSTKPREFLVLVAVEGGVQARRVMGYELRIPAADDFVFFVHPDASDERIAVVSEERSGVCVAAGAPKSAEFRVEAAIRAALKTLLTSDNPKATMRRAPDVREIARAQVG